MSTWATSLLLVCLYVLLSVVAVSVTKTASRKRRSPLGIPAGAGAVRAIVCGVFLVVAFGFFHWSIKGASTGRINEVYGTRLTSGHVAKVYLAREPGRFWAVVSIDCFLGLLFLYFTIAELVIAYKRDKYFRKISPAGMTADGKPG